MTQHVGIIGAGQLGQMLALAGIRLGLQFTFLDPSSQPPAARIGRHIQAEFDDEFALEQLAVECDLMTLEFENVPVSAAHAVSQHATIRPGPRALAVAQDRLEEKAFFDSLGIPVGAHAAVDDLEQLHAALDAVGRPAILKTRRLGYDGKGQAVIREGDDPADAWAAIGGHPAILEAMVPFEREISVIAARRPSGQVACYPVSENTHRGGILHRTVVHSDDPLQAQAEKHIRRVLTELDYVGVLAMEFFVLDGGLLANEMAPRVHNSGHWSIDGAQTSQFENHLRAILDWPLGSTDTLAPSIMINLIGSIREREALLAIPGLHLHDYGKPPRTGRKVGHLTITADSMATCRERAARAEAILGL